MVYDNIIIGGGIAGLVAAHEITKAGKSVLLIDQENEKNLGGQAFWSLGGLFLVDSPQQRRMGIKDSFDLAWQDWKGTAAFDRAEDEWPRKWAEAYVKFAAFEKYKYVTDLGVNFVPIPGWAERGDGSASGQGNSVPRFHIAWGTGTGIIKPFVEKAYQAQKHGRLEMKFRHRVTALTTDGNRITGINGDILEKSEASRGVASSRRVVGNFSFEAKHVLIASGGIGANFNLVRKNWPAGRLGKPPESMICGVPAYVDGSMLEIAENSGAAVINRDRMWHYTEGIKNFAPIWPNHAIRILPGPSSMWFDARGHRLPPPFLPGFDTMGTLQHICTGGYDYSWFILNQKIIKKEFALSGSEQNPDLTSRSFKGTIQRIVGKEAPAPVEAFKKNGEDFLIAGDLKSLVDKMNALSKNELLVYEEIKQQIEDRDRETENNFCKDTQVTFIKSHRRYWGDKLMRVAPLHKILDSRNGPLIAVRLHILTRKTLGGLHTNLNGQVLKPDGTVLEGLFAAGEASGFGGGGMHGYRALEGTFLGGCIFSGIQAARYMADH